MQHGCAQHGAPLGVGRAGEAVVSSGSGDMRDDGLGALPLKEGSGGERRDGETKSGGKEAALPQGTRSCSCLQQRE